MDKPQMDFTCNWNLCSIFLFHKPPKKSCAGVQLPH